MSRWSRERDTADKIRRWPACQIAVAIDEGLIEQWPFELTRLGRRFKGWHLLATWCKPK